MMKVTIAGQYFFGGPVAKAKVHYKVIREPLIHPLPFQPRLDWFDYDGANQPTFGRRFRGGQGHRVLVARTTRMVR